MTMRSVDTRFWEDGWVRKLNALDRYMFLYFLTNTHTNWCGVYELDLAMMAFESGIDKEDLERSIFPRLSPKVIYVDGWVYIPNFGKYHNSNSEDARKGFKRAFEQVPEEIQCKIKEIETNYTLWGGTGGSRVPSAFTLASAFTPTLTEVYEDTEVTKPKKKSRDTKGFNTFWESYPNQADKVSAFAEWGKLSEEDKSLAIADVPQRSESEPWLKDDGKYIPLAKTYLKNRRWEDKIKKFVTMKF